MHAECANGRPRCPFFGFHWPEGTSNLIETGTDECGLDLDGHGPCKMALRRARVEFFRCETPARFRGLLEAGMRHIRFYTAEQRATGVGLEEWWRLTILR